MSALAPTYRAMLAAMPDEWGRSDRSVKITSKGLVKLQRLGLVEFRQIIDPDHTDTRFRPALLGQVRRTDAGRAALSSTQIPESN